MVKIIYTKFEKVHGIEDAKVKGFISVKEIVLFMPGERDVPTFIEKGDDHQNQRFRLPALVFLVLDEKMSRITRQKGEGMILKPVDVIEITHEQADKLNKFVDDINIEFLPD